MPTLADLGRAVFPTAVPMGRLAAERLAMPVTWVRVMKPRSPAFDALEAGDLAIVPETTLERLAQDVAEPDALVATVQGAGVSALLLVADGDDAPGPAAAVVAAQAGALGLPTWRLNRADAAHVERAVIGYLVNGRAELDRQAGALEARLEQLALAGAGAEAYAGAVAAFVGRATAIEGPRGEPVAVHAPPTPTTAARAAARYLADPRDVARRVPLAGVGALVLLGELPVTELEGTVAQRIAPLLALALSHGPGATPAARPRRPEGFPTAGPPWVVLMARQVVPGGGGRPEAREALRAAARRLAPARHLALRGDVDSLELRIVAVPPSDDPLALALAGRLAALAARPVAVSRPFTAPEARAVAEADARATLEAAGALPGSATAVAPVVRADRLAAYRLLGNLHNLADGRGQAEALLAPVLAERPARRARQLATLRAVLERPGVAAAAAALGIHRNTLGYRVRALERRTGWQLDDPDLRLSLLLALRLVHSDQWSTPE